VWHYSIGSALALSAGTIIPSVVIRYNKSKTPFFDVRKPAKALITDGPNRYSRNPGYLSLTLLYLGIGFMLNNIWIVGLSIPVILGMDLLIIRKEESHLESVFGEEYLRYILHCPVGCLYPQLNGISYFNTARSCCYVQSICYLMAVVSCYFCSKGYEC